LFCKRVYNKFWNLSKIIRFGNLRLNEIACEVYDTYYIYNRNVSWPTILIIALKTLNIILCTQRQDYHRFLGNRLLKVLLARKHLMCRTPWLLFTQFSVKL